MGAPTTNAFRVDDFPKTGLGTREAVESFFRNLNSQLSALSAPLSKGLTVANNMNAEMKDITFTVPGVALIGTTGAPAFEHSWAKSSAGQAPGYQILPTGEVEVFGVMDTGSANTVAFTLPSNLAPAATRQWATFVWTGSAGALGWVRIGTDGAVHVNTAATINQFWLDGVRFMPAAPATPGCFPITVTTTVSQPRLVMLGALSDQSTHTAVAVPGGVHWKNLGLLGGKQSFQILSLPGLTPGHTYQATFLIWGG